MNDFNVDFLNPVCISGIWNDKTDIRMIRDLSTIIPCQYDGGHIFIFGTFHRFKDIFGISACCDSEQNVPRFSYRFNKP